MNVQARIENADQFDEIFVVSDIHMGGVRSAEGNFQIFNRGERLAGLIESIRDRPADRDIAFVLNGDVFDTLAEPGMPVGHYTALDEKTAVEIVQRIMEDESFQSVWRAIGEFLRTPRRYVVMVIGNHDAELALQSVRTYIARTLTKGDDAARGRLQFATDGGGYACRVGRARVFCTHGNEVDPWNKLDFDKLAQLSNAVNAGRLLDPGRWEPNAGTRLVIDCMNKVKREWPFVDLLKPEIGPVLSVLAVFARKTVVGLVPKMPAVVRLKHKGEAAVEDLLMETRGSNKEDTLSVRQFDDLAAYPRSRIDEDDLLLDASFAPSSIDDDVDDDQAILGIIDAIGSTLEEWSRPLRDPNEALRRALCLWLRNDATFDPQKTNEIDDDVIARTDESLNFVIAGHTHLARAVEITPGRRYYFNSGTWIRLLRLTERALEPSIFATRVVPALKGGSLNVLDDAKVLDENGDEKDLIYDRTNVVRIADEGIRVIGELLRVTGDGKATPPGPESDIEPLPAHNPFRFEVSP